MASCYINPIILPAPKSVLKSLGEIFFSEKLLKEVWITLFQAFLGVSLSFLIALPIGILFGIKRKIFSIIKPVILFLQSTPVISLILIMLIWFPVRIIPLLIIFISALPIIVFNTYEGIISTDNTLINMAKVYKVPSKKILQKIYIPLLKSYLISTLNIVIGNSVKIIVMAEVLIHSPKGIGFELNQARINIETEKLFAWTIVIILLTYFFDKILNFFLVKRYNNVRNF